MEVKDLIKPFERLLRNDADIVKRSRLERVLSKNFPFNIDENKCLDKKYENEFGWRKHLAIMFGNNREVSLDQIKKNLQFALEQDRFDFALLQASQIMNKVSSSTDTEGFILDIKQVKKFLRRIYSKYKLDNIEDLNERTIEALIKELQNKCRNKSKIEQLNIILSLC